MSEQCKGITKSGGRCKITGSFSNGYCHRHQSQSDASAPEILTDTKTNEEKTAPPPSPDPVPQHEGENTALNDNLLPLVIIGVLSLLLIILFKRRRSAVRYIRL